MGQMLEDAIMGLASGHEGIGWNFKMPEGARVSNDELEKHLAITIKAWAEKRWLTFGQDLGELLQEMVITVFSQKYTLDSNGVLQRSVEQPIFALHTSAAAYLAIALSSAVAMIFGM